MGENIDFQELIKTYTKHWKWFVISVLAFFFLAKIHLRYATPIYKATAKIQVVEDKNSGIDLFKELDIFSLSKNNVLDEIDILKSRGNGYEVVKRLGLNTALFVVGDVKEKEVYLKRPININFVAADSIVNKSKFEFFIQFESDTSFGYSNDDKEDFRNEYFGNTIKTIIGDMVITPNSEVLQSYRGKKIRVAVTPIDEVAMQLLDRIEVVNKDEKSNIINLSLEDAIPEKAELILNELISIYNQNAIDDKKEIADATSTFIDNRINEISTNLTSVDQSAEDLRTSRGIADVSSQTNINLSQSASTNQDLVNAQNQLSIAQGMQDIIEQQEGFEVLPTNLGISDATIANTTANYNQLVQERNRLLQSSNEKNPVIVKLDQQIASLKKTMMASVNSTVNNLGLTVNTLSKQQSIINSKIYSAPGNERALRDIERKQQTIESLYVYLLQKREEAQIAAVATAPKSLLVDFPVSSKRPVAPRSIMIYLAAIMAGLLLPFGIIYVLDILNNKISNMKDLEGVVDDVPVIGELPRLSKKQMKNIKVSDRSVFGESLRIVRTNLDFLIKSRSHSGAKNNIIFVTSSVSNEGKSFVASSLSVILSSAAKRVLLLGADIRNPNEPFYFSEEKREVKKALTIGSGLTDFLLDSKVEVRDIVSTIEINNNQIDYISSGSLPPNPAELLLSERMRELFNQVSDRYDYVIVDTAPMMLVTDTLLLAKYSHHLVYVTRAGFTEKKAIEYPIKLLKDKKVKNLAFMVNDVANVNLGYGGMYGYGYGKEVKKWWNIKPSISS